MLQHFTGQGHSSWTFRCHVASQSLTPLSCAYNFFRSNFNIIAKYVLSSLKIGSGRIKFEIFHEQVDYLHSIITVIMMPGQAV